MPWFDTVTQIATAIVTLNTAITGVHTLGRRLGLWRWIRAIPRTLRVRYRERWQRKAARLRARPALHTGKEHEENKAR